MPLRAKSVLTFEREEQAANAAALLSEVLGDEAALAVGDAGTGWRLECYDDGEIARRDDWLELLVAAGLAPSAPPMREELPDADWVSLTQQGLPPVTAGRLTVHGSHHASLAHRRWSVLIDAGRAFGTAHHGTTRGCLIAIDRHMRAAKVARAVDLGTGSGVLAIAMVKAGGFKARVLALDIDPVAVDVAKKNCRANGVGAAVAVAISRGRVLEGRPKADLLAANILAGPLVALAETIRRSVRVGGSVILSGLLDDQAREVLAAYLARGFRKERVSHLEGWTSAVLRRGR